MWTWINSCLLKKEKWMHLVGKYRSDNKMRNCPSSSHIAVDFILIWNELVEIIFELNILSNEEHTFRNIGCLNEQAFINSS